MLIERKSNFIRSDGWEFNNPWEAVDINIICYTHHQHYRYRVNGKVEYVSGTPRWKDFLEKEQMWLRLNRV